MLLGALNITMVNRMAFETGKQVEAKIRGPYLKGEKVLQRDAARTIRYRVRKQRAKLRMYEEDNFKPAKTVRIHSQIGGLFWNGVEWVFDYPMWQFTVVENEYGRLVRRVIL